MLKQSVVDHFVEFSTKFEGKLNFPYLDIKGLVTVAIGNLIEPFSMAVGLPWRKGSPTGPLATHAEVQAGWGEVKNHQEARMNGGGWFKQIASIFLDDDGIEQVVTARLNQNAALLATRFPDLASWPADAQLGLMSIAWAAGAGAHMPKFEAACKARDWATAAVESHLEDSHNPGLRPRNAANKTLFLNAAIVEEHALDADKLYYPGVVTVDPVPVTVTEVPAEPVEDALFIFPDLEHDDTPQE